MLGSPHHVGCAVRQLELGWGTFGEALGFARRTRGIEVASQRVRVGFVELLPRFYLELIEPLEGNEGLARYLRTGFYHLCFLVDDLDSARAHLASRRFVALPKFESEAFSGSTCQFFLTPQSHLIELCEMGASEFDRFFEEQLESEG